MHSFRSNPRKWGIGLFVAAGLLLHGCALCKCPLQSRIEADPEPTARAVTAEDPQSSEPVPTPASHPSEQVITPPPMAEEPVSPPPAAEPVKLSSADVEADDPRVEPSRPPAPDLFGLTLYPSQLFLAPGQRKTAKITVTRKQGFKGKVAIRPAGLPSTVNSSGTSTIEANDKHGFLTLTARDTAPFGKSTVTIHATGTVNEKAYTRTQALPLVVTRQRGQFLETVPNFRTVGPGKKSPNKQFVARVEFRARVGQHHKYAATFMRTNGQPIGPPLAFYLHRKSKVGGVGFCQGSTVGVVLSANAKALGFNAEYMVAIQDLTDPQVLRTFPVKTVAGKMSSHRPRIFFSPDCTLAALLGSEKGRPAKTTVTLLDVLTGFPIAEEVQFRSSSFKGKVLIRKSQLVAEFTSARQTHRYPIPPPSQGGPF